MSIKSLFENIANAIKNVYGTTDTLTPAEMPEAITNFNSIFQTKNLSAPISGQTTVEGCLSSLSSDLSELHNYTLDTYVDISSYVEGQSTYTCPSDGYFMVTSDAANHVVIGCVSHKSLITAFGTSTEPYFHSTILVKKNSVLSISGNGTGAFFPLI